MGAHTQVTRREFLQTASVVGAGLVIGFYLPPGRGRVTAATGPFAPNAWLRIGTDDSVLVMVDRSEMGQGVATSLPMLLAEELEADWSKIKIEFAPADKAYTNPMFGMQGTGGSTSVRAAFTPLRKAGAAARELLVAAAAQTWSVDKAECRAERGAVIHTPSKRRLTYGKLAAKAAVLPAPAEVPLKDPKDWKILGTRVRRLDTPPKVDGSAQFGIDVRMPGMLVAVIARCPVFGGKVASFDATKAKAVPGVRQVVQISTGVAVVADGYWPAKKGRDALEVSWDEGPNASVSSASIAQLFGQRAEQPGAVARHDGDAEAALASAGAKVDAVYDAPFLAHATMEPMNCTAHVRPDGVDIWAPTQFQTGCQQLGAGVGGVAPEKVQVHTTYLGGGFGRRFELDFIREALETSKAAGVPVKVIWSREDDIRQAQYRPACRHSLRAGPAAGKAGWGAPLPAGRARGIAVYKAFESYVAQVAEVSVESDGAVRVHRVVCAVDCGPVVNPDIVEAQMQGGIVYGLTAALWGEITIDKGRVQQSNFPDYRMLRMAEMPRIELYIVPSSAAQGGVGEPGTPPIAPAVCNAIFALTGKRLRKLPIGKVV